MCVFFIQILIESPCTKSKSRFIFITSHELITKNKNKTLGETMEHQPHRIIAISNKSSGMLAGLCNTISEQGCSISSISSLRLGHSFVVVLMVGAPLNEEELTKVVNSVAKNHELELIVSRCENKKYTFVKSDAFIRVRGKPVNGLNARIISLLTDAGLDIHSLESDIYQKNGTKIFTINIKGKATNGIESLAEIAQDLQEEGLDITVSTDWSLLI